MVILSFTTTTTSKNETTNLTTSTISKLPEDLWYTGLTMIDITVSEHNDNDITSSTTNMLLLVLLI